MRFYLLIYTILFISGCAQEKKMPDCDKRMLLQKCLNYINTLNREDRIPIIIYNKTITDSIPLVWGKKRVSFEHETKDNMTAFLRSENTKLPLYILIDTINCSDSLTRVGLVVVNANLKYELIVKKHKNHSDSIYINQEIDDYLPYSRTRER